MTHHPPPPTSPDGPSARAGGASTRTSDASTRTSGASTRTGDAPTRTSEPLGEDVRVPAPRPIQAVFFDIGETLINEGEIYGRWADWFGVPRHTFLTKLGAILATGGTHQDLFEYFRPGFDLEAEEKRRADAGVPNGFGADDLYPDARECLAALHGQGLYVGIAGNQPVQAAEQMEALGLDADVIGISDVWGVQKPAAEFFERCAQIADVLPDRVLYVGDRIDNDARPAIAFGMRAAFLRRGPWGHIQEDDETLAECLFVLDDLEGLPALVARYNAP